MIKVLFVCLGNICRSPTAEGVCRGHVISQGYSEGYGKDFFIDSAGTSDYHIGDAPDPRTRQIAHQYGVNLDNLRGRQLTRQDFKDFDYLIAMDEQNLRNMKKICPPDLTHKLSLMMDHATDCPGIREVPDPYTGGMEGFDRVFDIIERASTGLFDKICQEYKL